VRPGLNSWIPAPWISVAWEKVHRLARRKLFLRGCYPFCGFDLGCWEAGQPKASCRFSAKFERLKCFRLVEDKMPTYTCEKCARVLQE
jgi:hypothetical protein